MSTGAGHLIPPRKRVTREAGEEQTHRKGKLGSRRRRPLSTQARGSGSLSLVALEMVTSFGFGTFVTVLLMTCAGGLNGRWVEGELWVIPKLFKITAFLKCDPHSSEASNSQLRNQHQQSILEHIHRPGRQTSALFRDSQVLS